MIARRSKRSEVRKIGHDVDSALVTHYELSSASGESTRYDPTITRRQQASVGDEGITVSAAQSIEKNGVAPTCDREMRHCELTWRG